MEFFRLQELSPEESAERFRIIQYKARELQIEEIWNKFEAAGFQPILIKGWAAAQVYPQPYKREFVDIDLIVAPGRFEEAEAFLKNLKPKLPVDLHKGARHLDSLSFADLLENSVFVKCGDTNLRVPRPEDHLRILCNHWLTDGGANREKLWDIYYSVSNRSSDFDWRRLLDSVGLRRRRWVECAIGLAHKYLDLDLKDTPVEDASERLPRWIIKAVEKEWASDVKMEPLNLHLKNKKMLWRQIKKRLPPNPVQATVLQEGDFDRYPRIWYQINNMLSRLKPSLKRIEKSLRGKTK